MFSPIRIISLCKDCHVECCKIKVILFVIKEGSIVINHSCVKTKHVDSSITYIYEGGPKSSVTLTVLPQ